MLKDEDRIFTNLYGWMDPGLKGAKARGDWDGTAKLIKLCHDEIVERVKASGLRGRGGARRNLDLADALRVHVDRLEVVVRHLIKVLDGPHVVGRDR
jgi:hypothetical protein